MSSFSRLYIERGKPVSDSVRMRTRMASFMQHRLPTGSRMAEKILEALGTDMGITVEGHSTPYWNLMQFFRQGELRDVLDAVTAVCWCLKIYPDSLRDWRATVISAFHDENAVYRLGKDDIVHPLVDPEFDANYAAALNALGDSRFGEARQDFDSAFRHLRNKEGKQAVRMMFPAVETAAKVLFPGKISRLMPNDAQKLLGPVIRHRYAGNDPATTAGLRVLECFERWIVASQPYRHGQEVETSIDPPEELVVAHLSIGAACLRWMIEVRLGASDLPNVTSPG